jgi:hypothetical protein
MSWTHPSLDQGVPLQVILQIVTTERARGFCWHCFMFKENQKHKCSSIGQLINESSYLPSTDCYLLKWKNALWSDCTFNRCDFSLSSRVHISSYTVPPSLSCGRALVPRHLLTSWPLPHIHPGAWVLGLLAAPGTCILRTDGPRTSHPLCSFSCWTPWAFMLLFLLMTAWGPL